MIKPIKLYNLTNRTSYKLNIKNDRKTFLNIYPYKFMLKYIMDKLKKCVYCGKEKLISEYYKGSTEKDGFKSKCKKCYLKATSIWRNKNPKYMTEYALNNRKITKQKYGLSLVTIQRHGLKLSLEVYDRANRKCENCGTEFDLTIHHKDRNGRNNMDKKLFVNNTLDNLQILCRSCHGRLHTIQRWKEKK